MAGLTDGQRSLSQRLIASLDRDGLLELMAMAEARLAELEEELDPIQETSSNGSGKAKAGADGWIDLKMIPGANGKLYGPYAYRRWRVGKSLKSQYLGKVKQEQ